ncbi:MAG: hypothetical protein JWR63_1262 [Conexibacter sp.]|nr:hypothetical protein [Conexibacter sp.]
MLALLREQKGFSPEQLAVLVGTSRRTIGKIEKRRQPGEPAYRVDLRVMRNCAVVLGVTLDDLVDGDWEWTSFRADAAKPPGASRVAKVRDMKLARKKH